MKEFSLGEFRKLTKDLPDSAGIYPDWLETPTMEGSISYEGAELGTDQEGKPCVLLKIEEHLWDDDEDDIDEEDDSDLDDSFMEEFDPYDQRDAGNRE